MERRDARLVLGPLRLAEDEPFEAAGSPISRALRRLKVDRGRHVDEFDAVGLGRHRDTDDWSRRPPDRAVRCHVR